MDMIVLTVLQPWDEDKIRDGGWTRICVRIKTKDEGALFEVNLGKWAVDNCDGAIMYYHNSHSCFTGIAFANACEAALFRLYFGQVSNTVVHQPRAIES